MNFINQASINAVRHFDGRQAIYQNTSSYLLCRCHGVPVHLYKRHLQVGCVCCSNYCSDTVLRCSSVYSSQLLSPLTSEKLTRILKQAASPPLLIFSSSVESGMRSSPRCFVEASCTLLMVRCSSVVSCLTPGLL